MKSKGEVKGQGAAKSRPLSNTTPRNRLLATGLIGFAASMLGCLTPALVALFAALGISGSAGWLDYVLMPAMAAFAAITAYAILCRLRRRRI
ncbi:MAG: mercury resistance system transport protein MerF [Stellaceae bacterium]